MTKDQLAIAEKLQDSDMLSPDDELFIANIIWQQRALSPEDFKRLKQLNERIYGHGFEE